MNYALLAHYAFRSSTSPDPVQYGLEPTIANILGIAILIFLVIVAALALSDQDTPRADQSKPRSTRTRKWVFRDRAGRVIHEKSELLDENGEPIA